MLPLRDTPGVIVETSCPSCQAKYRFEAARVPEGGGRAICPRCGFGFMIRNERARIWVLADDPALRSQVARSTLQDLTRELDLCFLSRRRDEIVEVMGTEHTPLPDVLIFGDMHVLLEDPVLLALRSTPRVRRLLVSTHYNAELLEAAEAFCQVSTHIVLPSSDEEVRLRLASAVRIEVGTPPPILARSTS